MTKKMHPEIQKEILERFRKSFGNIPVSSFSDVFKNDSTRTERMVLIYHPDGGCECAATSPSKITKHQEALEGLKREGTSKTDRGSVGVEALKDKIEEIISDTHDVDVKDHHYAKNIVDYLVSQGHLTAPQWQPIETAPKDGTEILAKSLNTWHHVKWNLGEGLKGWLRVEDENLVMNPEFFTAWMPLPEPPQTDSAEVE